MNLYPKILQFIFFNIESQLKKMLILESICYWYHYHLPMNLWEGNVFSQLFMSVYSQWKGDSLYGPPLLPFLYIAMDTMSTLPHPLYRHCTGSWTPCLQNLILCTGHWTPYLQDPTLCTRPWPSSSVQGPTPWTSSNSSLLYLTVKGHDPFYCKPQTLSELAFGIHLKCLLVAKMFDCDEYQQMI